jgi:hypothetical protein
MTRHLSGFNHITIFSPSYPSHNGLVLLQACSVKKYMEQELFASKRGLCLKYKHEPRGSWHDLCARKVSQYEWNLVSTRDRRLPMPRCCSHSLACCRFGHRQKKRTDITREPPRCRPSTLPHPCKRRCRIDSENSTSVYQNRSREL